jgi:hypothetical protein
MSNVCHIFSQLYVASAVIWEKWKEKQTYAASLNIRLSVTQGYKEIFQTENLKLLVLVCVAILGLVFFVNALGAGIAHLYSAWIRS